MINLEIGQWYHFRTNTTSYPCGVLTLGKLTTIGGRDDDGLLRLELENATTVYKGIPESWIIEKIEAHNEQAALPAH